MLPMNQVREYVRLDQTHMLSAEEKALLLDGISLVERRYAVYTFTTNQEYYDVRSADTPEEVFEKLDDAISFANEEAKNEDIDDYYERYVAVVMDRMTDEEVYTTECVKEASEKLVIQPRYGSLWDVYNAGAIDIDEYNKLKKLPWPSLSPLLNADGARITVNKLFERFNTTNRFSEVAAELINNCEISLTNAMELIRLPIDRQNLYLTEAREMSPAAFKELIDLVLRREG